jgi:hypothetical protein
VSDQWADIGVSLSLDTGSVEFTEIYALFGTNLGPQDGVEIGAPEPSTLSILGAGLIGLAAARPLNRCLPVVDAGEMEPQKLSSAAVLRLLERDRRAKARGPDPAPRSLDRRAFKCLAAAVA